MRAVVYDRYGPPEVLRLEEAERPVPKADEVCIKVYATTVTRTDCGWRSAKPYFFVRFLIGLTRPRRRTLGMEVAGEVDARGSDAGEFQIGDRIFGISGFGAYGEFVCVRQSGPLARIPEGLSYEEAAAVADGGCTALSCLRQAGLEKGQQILIYGASGSIGTAAVQLAKYLGAHVTAVCNAKNVELVRSLGADTVIDYEREDFTKTGKTFDIVFDAVGKQSFMRSRRSLKPHGIFMSTDLGFMWHLPLLVLLTKWPGSRRAMIGVAQYKKQDVVLLRELIERHAYRPVIDRSFPLAQVVDATRYVETGQKVGNVVLLVAGWNT